MHSLLLMANGRGYSAGSVMAATGVKAARRMVVVSAAAPPVATT